MIRYYILYDFTTIRDPKNRTVVGQWSQEEMNHRMPVMLRLTVQKAHPALKGGGSLSGFSTGKSKDI